MYAPPTAPMPKKNNTLTIILVSVSAFCILLCVGGGIAMFQGAKSFGKQIGPMLGCTTDLESVRNAIKAYADKNGTYPPADKWMDEVKPFVVRKDLKELKDNPIMKVVPMDLDKPWGCKATESNTYAYAYNSEVAGKKPGDISAPQSTVLVFETDSAPEWNKAMPYAKPKTIPEPKIMNQPREWLVAFVSGDVDFSAEGGKVKGSARD